MLSWRTKHSSIQRLVSKTNRSNYIYDGNNQWDIHRYRQSDILIIVVNGDALEKMKTDLRKPVKGDVLKYLLTNPDNKTIIFLTNLDTIFLLCNLRYRYSAGNLNLLKSFQVMVVDEVHLYDGMELANLLFMIYFCKRLGIYEKLVLLSATPNEEVKKIIDNLFHLTVIDGSFAGLPALRRQQVVHDVQFSVIPAEDFVSICIGIIKQRKAEIDNMPLSSDNQPVPVVIIVDSVIQAIRIEDELIVNLKYPVAEIASYRGLVNSKVRDLQQRRFVVGTSAIEIGVDFDCNLLIFNARERSSFIERFGRVGRHRPGEAILIADHRSKESLKLIGDQVSRDSF